MNTHRFAFFCAMLVALLPGCATTEPAANSGTAQPAATATNGPEHSLQKGMTAEAVRNIMGEPAEIKPMQVPAGKAETWIYHRTTSGINQQVMLGTEMVQQFETVDETISLLMFNDKLMDQTTSTKRRLEYK